MFKKVYSLYSAFYPSLRFTLSLQSAFYPWSAVCSLQSAVRSLRFTLTDLFFQILDLAVITIIDDMSCDTYYAHLPIKT